MDQVHGEDYFKFGDKVTYWGHSGAAGQFRWCQHMLVIGFGDGVQREILRCATSDGAVLLYHPRLLDLGWNTEQKIGEVVPR